MLAELDHQNADARAVAADAAIARAEAADRALRMAEVERDNALADVDMWRNSAVNYSSALRVAQDHALVDRDLAAHELATAKQAAAGANNAHRELGIQHMQLRTLVTAVLANMAALPQIPKVRQAAAKLREALELS
jgi:hypothetical protein